jgi:hypothetical protein
MPTQPAQHFINQQPVYALSISGPFARWIAGEVKLKEWGQKSIEVRPWNSSHRNIWVLLHVSQSSDYDEFFDLMPFTSKDCPKSSIVGAAVLSEVIRYDESKQWEQDRRKHCWLGSESYSEVCHGYGKAPFGHMLTQQILFDEPILNVPGDRAYWQPNAKKPDQAIRQRPAFEKAIAKIEADLARHS